MVTTRMVSVGLVALAMACSRRPTSETGAGTESPSVNANTAQLKTTYWKLTGMGSTPVNVADSQREPHMIFAADSKQITGAGGCNRMFGSYELNGDALVITGVGSTKMACQNGMDVENSFLSSLQRVAKYRIAGQSLELLDASGAVVAQFDAKSK